MPYNIVTSQIGKKPIKDIKKDVADVASGKKTVADVKKSSGSSSKKGSSKSSSSYSSYNSSVSFEAGKKYKSVGPATAMSPHGTPPDSKHQWNWVGGGWVYYDKPKTVSSTSVVTQKNEPVTQDSLVKSMQDNNLNLIASNVKKQQQNFNNAQQPVTPVVQTGNNMQKAVPDTKSRGFQEQNDVLNKSNIFTSQIGSKPIIKIQKDIDTLVTEQKQASKKSVKPKNDDIIMNQSDYASLTITKNKLTDAANTYSQWKPDPKAAYYTFPEKDYDPTIIHGPGASIEKAADLKPDEPGIQLSPEHAQLYMQNLGKRLKTQASTINTEDNIVDYVKKHGTFKFNDKEMSYQELKKQEPALFLKKTPDQGVKLEYDYTKWYNEQDDVTKTIGRVGGGFANLDYIVETVGRGNYDKGDSIVAKWTYEQKNRLKNNDYFGTIVNIPSVQNVALPAMGGMLFGAVARGASALNTSIAQKGFTTLSKGLSFTGKAATYGATSVVGTVAAVDIASTKADKKVAKALTYGTQFASFGVGAKAAQNAKIPKVQKEIIEYKIQGEPTRMVGQKYVEIFGKKIDLPGKTIAVGPKQAPVQVTKGFGSGETSLTIKPDLGFKNVGGKPSSIFDIKMPSNVQVSTWQGKTFIETGVGWQPKTGIYKSVARPITIYSSKMPVKVKPIGKPAIFGKYKNIPYVRVLKEPMFLESGSLTTTEGMVKIIPRKKPIFKDFNKEFRSIDQQLKNQPTVSQGQKQQTVQVLKLKPLLKQKTKTALQLKQKQSLMQAQKQVLVQSSAQKVALKTEKKSMFHPEYQVKAIGQLKDIKTIKAVFPGLIQGQSQAKASLVAMATKAQQSMTGQTTYPVYDTKKASDTLKDTLFDVSNDFNTPVNAIPKKSYVPFTPKIPVEYYSKTPKLPPITITSTIMKPFIIEFDGKKRKKKRMTFDNFFTGYRERSWKVPTMKELIGVDY